MLMARPATLEAAEPTLQAATRLRREESPRAEDRALVGAGASKAAAV